MHCLMNAWQNNESNLYHWLLKQTHDSELSRDLLQDVFLKSLEHQEQFCTLEHAKSWLFTITRNTLIDVYRKRGETIELTTEQLSTGLEQEITEAPTWMQLEPCMLRVLTELNDRDREIIEHCDIEKMSQKAYSDQFGLSLPATKSRLKRARQKLREKMVADCKIQFDETGVSDFTLRR